MILLRCISGCGLRFAVDEKDLNRLSPNPPTSLRCPYCCGSDLVELIEESQEEREAK